MAMVDNELKCGYITIYKNHVYDGSYSNGTQELVYNGMIMFPENNKLIFKESDNEFMIRESAEIYDNLPAYRVLVRKLNELCYFIENTWDFNDSDVYDTRRYAVEADALLNAHPLEEGEEFLISASLVEANNIQPGKVLTVSASGNLKG